jgi:hypothetical protein
MRTDKLSAEEILKAEKVADDHKRGRAKGFEKMRERDANHGVLHEYIGKAREVHMLWGEPGMFALDVRLYGDKSVVLVFDADEFRRLLRWV